MMKNTPLRRITNTPTPMAIRTATATDSASAAAGGQPHSIVAPAVAYAPSARKPAWPSDTIPVTPTRRSRLMAKIARIATSASSSLPK